MSVLGGTTTPCVAAPAVAAKVPWAVVPVPGTVAAVAAAASAAAAAAAAAAAVVANQKHLDQHGCAFAVGENFLTATHDRRNTVCTVRRRRRARA